MRLLPVLALLPALAAAAAAPPPAPVIADFRLVGTRWTCTAEGRPLAGLLWKPEGAGPFAGVLISHGLGGTAERFAPGKAREFGRWGAVCIATDYTHAGPARQGGDRATFGASAENVRRARACLAILKSLPEVDGKRLAAYGNSMGAFLTVGLAADDPTALRAAAITAGGIAPAEGLPAPSEARAAKVRTPFVLFHGDADTTVPPERSAALQRVLEREQVPVERHLFPGIGHGVHTERGEEVNRLTRAWFARHGVLPG